MPFPSNALSEMPFRVYTDPEQYAREQTIFKARVVPGLCILVAVEGLYVLTGHTHHGRAYLGLDELRLVAPVLCGDTIRAVEYRSYTIDYCPTCQTGGKILADNTTSKFLK